MKQVAEIAMPSDAIEEPEKGEVVALWPWFDWAGKSERLDQLWARYRDERLCACIPDNTEDFVERYYSDRPRPPVMTTMGGHDLPQSLIAEKLFEIIEGETRIAGEYEKAPLLVRPDGTFYRGKGGAAPAVSRFSDMRLKPFMQARTALKKAITNWYSRI